MTKRITKRSLRALFGLVALLALALVVITAPPVTAQATNVSNTVYTSNLVQNDELVLTGDTTLFINADLTLKSISGNYTLEIQSDGAHTLTVNNPNGCAISVTSLQSVAPSQGTVNLTVKGGSGYFAIATDGNISLNGVKLDVTGSSGIRSANGNVTINGTNVSVVGQNGVGVIANKGSIYIDSDYLFVQCAGQSGDAYWEHGIGAVKDITIISDDATITGLYGVDSDKGNITLSGNIWVGATNCAIIANEGTITMTGSVTAQGGDGYFAIAADGNISFDGTNFDVKGDSGIRSLNGDVTINGTHTSVVGQNGVGVIANSGSISIDSDYLFVQCAGQSGDATWEHGIGAVKDITIISDDATITGRWGVYSETGNVALTGNIWVGATNCAIEAEEGTITMTGSVTVQGGDSNYAIYAEGNISFDGTKLNVNGGAGIRSYEGNITIAGSQVSVVGEYGVGIIANGGSINIDSDYLFVQCEGQSSETDWRHGVAGMQDVTIVSEDATIVGSSYGVYSEKGNVTLKGNFSITGTVYRAIDASYGDINIEGSLLFRGGEDTGYAISADNFTFVGSLLHGSGRGGIQVEDKVLSITAQTVDIETDYEYALYSSIVRVDSEQVRLVENGLNEEWNDIGLYHGAVYYSQELTMNVNEAYICGSRGIRAEGSDCIATLTGNFTVIGTQEQAINDHGEFNVYGSLSARSDRGYDDDSWHGCTLYLHDFTFIGTTLAVEGVNKGLSAFKGDVVISAQNVVILSAENYAIDAESLMLEADRATIVGKTAIYAQEQARISGNNIVIESTGSSNSGIWCEGDVTLAGNIAIWTNGWYGINAEGDLTIEKGYYKISGPKNNAQAVKTGGKLTVDKTMQIVEPDGGHVNGNNINGAGDSPAMYLLMYAAVGQVDIYLSTPSDGQLPLYDSSAIYGLPQLIYFDSIRWFENGVEMESGDRFTAGNTYSAELILYAEEGYYFTDGVLAKVNGKSSSMTGTMDGKTRLMIRVDLGKCSTAITSVSLSITAPVDGNKPSTSVTANGSHYGVRSSNVKWFVSNDGINFTAMASGAKFVGGKYYRVQMDVTLSNSNYAFKITTKDGYLDSDVLATVNGRLASVTKAYDQDPEEVITVILDFGLCNDSVVEKVTVVDIAAPVAGAYPSYHCNVFGTGYKLNDYSKYEDIYWKNPPEKWYYVKNGIQWWDVTTGSWEYVYDNTQFIPGHKYVCEIRLVVEDGYEFAGNGTAITATINGNTAEINEGWTNRTEARIFYTFTCEAKSITTIMIDGIDTPVTGKTPDHTASVAYPEYYQIDTTFGNGGIQWYDCEYAKLGVNEVFGDAAPYCLAIRIVSAQSSGVDLVRFAENVTVYINGKEVAEYGRWDGVKVEDNTVTVYYTFRKGASAPEVDTSPKLFLTQPKGGSAVVGQAHKATWQTNFVPDKTEFQYWDGEKWAKWDAQYPREVQDSYEFVMIEAGTYQFRIVLYLDDTIVATSEVFEVTYFAEYLYAYYPGEASGSPDFDIVADGTQITLAECMFEAPAGKRFKAWAIGGLGGQQKQPGEKITITAETYIYAIWEDIPHTHTYNGTWSHDGETHWKQCTDPNCPDPEGSKTDLAFHVPNGATCTQAGTCFCGRGGLYGDHDFENGTFVKHDEQYHVTKCAHCSATNTDFNAHTGGTATCTGKAICDGCHQAYGNLDPNVHSATAEWTKTANTHKKAYGCCQAVVVAEEAHQWQNGVCSQCQYVCQHPTDQNKDHKCDACGLSVGKHEAAAGKHTCDYCSQTVTQCADETKDHKCDICGAAMGKHEAPAGSHICTYCGKEASGCTDGNDDGKCDVCGKNVGDCVDVNKDHKCDKHGETMGTHEAATGKHTCDYCGQSVTQCADENKDHKCDVCGAAMGTHEAATGKHSCDYCGQSVTQCADENKDHKCDVCGAAMGKHEAATGKHTCDYCGQTVSSCSDDDKDGMCDVCGKDLGTVTPTQPTAPTTPTTPTNPTTPATPTNPTTPATPTKPAETTPPTTSAPAGDQETPGSGPAAGVIIGVAVGCLAFLALVVVWIKKKK